MEYGEELDETVVAVSPGRDTDGRPGNMTDSKLPRPDSAESRKLVDEVVVTGADRPANDAMEDVEVGDLYGGTELTTG